MIFHHVLDVVFATWSHIAVLRVMQDSAHGLTGREIARLSQMNHRSCLKALSTLEAIAIVSRHRGGRDHLFTLNRDHLLVSDGLLPLLKLERELLEHLARLLKKNFNHFTDSLILFGSVARKKENLQSDLDLCLVIDRVANKELVLERVHTISAQIRKKYGANLAPFIITKKEFLYKAKRKQPPVAAILKEGIVITGRSMRELTND